MFKFIRRFFQKRKFEILDRSFKDSILGLKRILLLIEESNPKRELSLEEVQLLDMIIAKHHEDLGKTLDSLGYGDLKIQKYTYSFFEIQKTQGYVNHNDRHKFVKDTLKKIITLHDTYGGSVNEDGIHKKFQMIFDGFTVVNYEITKSPSVANLQ